MRKSLAQVGRNEIQKPLAERLKNHGVRVRCLGPGAEHTFVSSDPATHRICGPCRRKLEAMPRHGRADDPVPCGGVE